MPLYEYKCNQCQHVFEELRSMKHMDDKTICPKCGFEDGKRQLSTFGVGIKENSKPIGCDKSSCGGCGVQ